MDIMFQIWNNQHEMFATEELHIFVRIADLGSLSSAARALGMPKSSVSRSLLRLEGAAGSSLIERSTRRMRLTDAGNLMLRHARRILDDVSEAENAMSGMIGVPKGTLRVNAPFTFTVGLLTPMLPAFLARYPDVRVSLFVESRPSEIFAKDADVAIRVGTLQDSQFIARKLAGIKLLLCASPAYLSAHGTPQTLNDLASHWLVGNVDRRFKWSFQNAAGEEEEFEFTPRTVVSEPAAAQSMIVGGAGIGRLPDYLAAQALAEGSLVRVLRQCEGEAVDAHALYPSHRSLSAKVRVFVDALATHLKKGEKRH